jgi:chemotaxis protein CheZ
MSDLESLRRDIVAMVEELRFTMQDIGAQDLPEENVISNARDRLRYIASLTEQSAGRTLNAAEAILDRLHAQQARAEGLARKTRSPEIRAFLGQLATEHRLSGADASEIIQAQAFQDLVGQVIGKLMTMTQKMEDNLVHLLVEDKPESDALTGPAVKPAGQVSQDDIDELFG